MVAASVSRGDGYTPDAAAGAQQRPAATAAAAAAVATAAAAAGHRLDRAFQRQLHAISRAVADQHQLSAHAAGAVGQPQLKPPREPLLVSTSVMFSNLTRIPVALTTNNNNSNNNNSPRSSYTCEQQHLKLWGCTRTALTRLFQQDVPQLSRPRIPRNS